MTTVDIPAAQADTVSAAGITDRVDYTERQHGGCQRPRRRVGRERRDLVVSVDAGFHVFAQLGYPRQKVIRSGG